MVRWLRTRKPNRDQVIVLDEPSAKVAPREIILEPEADGEPETHADAETKPVVADSVRPTAAAARRAEEVPTDPAPRRWHRA